MSHLNVDTVEEDAADLQFPKDWISSDEHYKELDLPVERKKILILDLICFTCKSLVTEPYIQCTICDSVLLCISCFAKGQERANHKNNHNYTIVENNFVLIDSSNWTAKEEKNLIELIEEYGFGNWADISFKLPGRSLDECKEHYLQYYIDNQFWPHLPKIKETRTNIFGPESIFYINNLKEIENPPRFTQRSINCKLMAGYNPTRSDFEFNFDNHAEQLIVNLNYNQFSKHDSQHDLAKNLQLSIMNAYNTRLKERVRRKKVIKEHGFISLKKTISSLQRYDVTVTRPLMDRLRIFTQILNGIQFDSIVECLHQVGELKFYIQKLFNYRKNGIKYFHSILLFEELSKLQKEFEREKKKIVSLECKWQNVILINTNYNSCINNLHPQQRKKASPIIINGMQGYEKLSFTEKNLCSLIRIFPEAYINYKILLINENKKFGFVRLAQARQLLKIDVNKTKKIHELLVNEGYINIS